MSTELPNTPNNRLSSFVNSHQYTNDPSTIDVQLNYGGGTAREVHDVEDGKIRQFAQDVLGWSVRKKNELTGQCIERHLPARHPDLPHLFASNISGVQGLATTGSRDGSNGKGDQAAAFKVNRYTISYSTPNYNILDDGAVEKEWQRYTALVGVEPIIEFYRRKVGTRVWVNDAANPNKNQPITGAVGSQQLVRKQRIKMLWVQVPDDGLFTAQGFFKGGAPVKLEAALGCVNDDTFFGREAGTMLFEGYNIIPRITHTDPFADDDRLRFCWDVELIFVYFNPPPGDSSKRGHNLLPQEAGEMLWWRHIPSTTGATDSSSYWLYPEADFDTIFEMNAIN